MSITPRWIQQSESSGKFKAISLQGCRKNQPIALTNKQLAEVQTLYPNLLRSQDILRYSYLEGSDDEEEDIQEINFVCPRYWCLQNNQIVSPSEVYRDSSGKLRTPSCQHLSNFSFPSTKKIKTLHDSFLSHQNYSQTIDFNAFRKIYEKSNTQSMKKGDLEALFERYASRDGRMTLDDFYLAVTPSLRPVWAKTGNNDTAFPCCSIKKSKCAGKASCASEALSSLGERTTTQQVLRFQQRGTDLAAQVASPLPEGTFGFLPPSLQQLFQTQCTSSKYIGPRCLFRKGASSFLAAISHSLPIPSSESSLRRQIAAAISLDDFVNYQNGQLVQEFAEREEDEVPTTTTNEEKYATSKLRQSLHPEENPQHAASFTRTVAAFEQFKRYLVDPASDLNHVLLWDILCTPNEFLFPQGCNLVIFQISSIDRTDVVEILCPSNHYAYSFFDETKPTLLLLKWKDALHYEPICAYVDGKVVTLFEKGTHPAVEKILRDVVVPAYEANCRPRSSQLYLAKRPPVLHVLVEKLENKGYSVEALVLQFDNKVVGVVIKESEARYVVPCYPSTIDLAIPHLQQYSWVYIDHPDLWTNYAGTIRFLTDVGSQIPQARCTPAFLVVEENVVVGILTQGNQFVQVYPFEQYDSTNPLFDLPIVDSNSGYVTSVEENAVPADAVITSEEEEDTERTEFVRKMRLEIGFLAVFREVLRQVMIRDADAKAKMKQLVQLEVYKTDSEKMRNVLALMHSLLEDKVQFTGDTTAFDGIEEVPPCVQTQTGKCVLILPKKNLMTGRENEPIYYSKIADEFVRYTRLQNYLFGESQGNPFVSLTGFLDTTTQPSAAPEDDLEETYE